MDVTIKPIPDPDPERGLEDPRDVGPSPDLLEPDPIGPADGGAPPKAGKPPGEPPEPAEDAPGMVDPRDETLGPEI